VVGACL